jgi:hypothetical protein
VPELRAVPDENHRLERAVKIGFAVIAGLLVIAAVIQILYVRLGNERTSEVAEAQQQIQVAQEQADRNLAVQACSSEYARTYTFWDAEADRLYAVIVKRAVDRERPSAALLARFQQAGENESEMNRRGLGVARLASDEAEAGGNNFACPAIPDRLAVEPLDPTNPNPP